MTDISTPDPAGKIWKLAKSIRIAMLTTRHDGGLVARPMHAIIPGDGGVVWFITERHSAKVADASHDDVALLTFSNGMDGDHVVMTGTVVPDDDRAKLASLWNPGATIYFPKGPADAAATLLKFVPAKAEYWTGGSGIVASVLDFARAKITGERPDTGNHESISM